MYKVKITINQIFYSQYVEHIIIEKYFKFSVYQTRICAIIYCYLHSSIAFCK